MSPASRDGDLAYRTEYNPRNYGEYRPFVANDTADYNSSTFSGARHRPNKEVGEDNLTVSAQQSRRIGPNNTKSYNGFVHRLKSQSNSTLDVSTEQQLDEMNCNSYDNNFSTRNILSSTSVTDLTRGIGNDTTNSGNLASSSASGVSSRYLIRHSARRSDSREPWLTSIQVTSGLNVERSEKASPKANRGKSHPNSTTAFSSTDNVSDTQEAYFASSARDINDDTLARKHFPITLFTPAEDPCFRPRVPSSKPPFKPHPSSESARQYGQVISSSSVKGQDKIMTERQGMSVRTKVNGLRLSTAADGSNRHHRRTGNRSDSVQSSSSSNSCSSIGQMYLMAIESPPGNGNLMLSSTPFETELERLRMNRLRLEEERIVHQKMHVQARHARPPVERWYELKSPQFNYELRKHNDRIKSSSGAL